MSLFNKQLIIINFPEIKWTIKYLCFKVEINISLNAIFIPLNKVNIVYI